MFNLWMSFVLGSTPFDSLLVISIENPFYNPAGVGRHPAEDPWQRPFSPSYYPNRHKIAGSPISGRFTFCLDGVQGDADFIAALFELKRFIGSIWITLFIFHVF